ncbi:hypothetical protein, partial [Achromobacter xylosoxidans]|uniref:hypothetical protein n=1 Tax=Alcaligenes xylosoxydans xylosoxydans TaxID=85698 RepID=UPI001F432061
PNLHPILQPRRFVNRFTSQQPRIASEVGYRPSWLATLTRPPYRVNPDSPSPAKPKTIAQFLQIVQLASA